MENKDKNNEYQEYITGKLGQIERKQDVNEEWINIKNVILESSNKKSEKRGKKEIKIGTTKNVRLQ